MTSKGLVIWFHGMRRKTEKKRKDSRGRGVEVNYILERGAEGACTLAERNASNGQGRREEANRVMKGEV